MHSSHNGANPVSHLAAGLGRAGCLAAAYALDAAAQEVGVDFVGAAREQRLDRHLALQVGVESQVDDARGAAAQLAADLKTTYVLWHRNRMGWLRQRL